MKKKLPLIALALTLALAACGGDDEHQAAAPDLPTPRETPGVPIASGQIDNALAQLDAIVQRTLADTGIPGAAVAVVRNGETVYAKGFGVRKAGEPAPVDADTVFQLASVSKSVGATVVAHQVGQGVVAWDTPIAQHLPWFALNDEWVTQHVTVGDMYAHRSGLPDHAGDSLEDIGYDRRQVLERLRFMPTHAFRDEYAYTNFGITTGAEAVAAASSTDWAALSEDVLYRPLGMTATSSRFADFIARANRAYPHVKVDGAYQAKYQRQPDAQSPAGGVSSNVRDMARWMAMVLGEGSFEGRQIVARAALLPAITPQIVAEPADTPNARAGAYGFGFNVGVQPSGRTTLSHSGAFLLGAGTNFVMMPSADLGIVVLTNAQPIGAAEAITAQFLDLVQFGRITRDWLAGYAGAFAPMLRPTGALVGQSPPAAPAPALGAEAYTGTYANAYYGEATVAQRDGSLVVTLGPAGVEHVLRHWDGNRFVFTPEGENAAAGSISAATFQPGPSGLASALTLEFYDENGLGTFTRR